MSQTLVSVERHDICDAPSLSPAAVVAPVLGIDRLKISLVHFSFLPQPNPISTVSCSFNREFSLDLEQGVKAGEHAPLFRVATPLLLDVTLLTAELLAEGFLLAKLVLVEFTVALELREQTTFSSFPPS